MHKIYLVRYYGGSYEDSWDSVIFATTKKTTATKYVTKFNRILKKYKDYYKQFEENKYGGIQWLKDEYIERHFIRWNNLQRISKCYYEEVSVR
jgi:hypothetical protein